MGLGRTPPVHLGIHMHVADCRTSLMPEPRCRALLAMSCQEASMAAAIGDLDALVSRHAVETGHERGGQEW